MIVNKERIWNHLQELGKIGRNEDGSITRLSYTVKDRMAQELLKNYMQKTEALVHEDAVGNLMAILPGTDTSLPPIICGSHFDSVHKGGIFDGCLGVIGAIEVMQILKEYHQKLQHTFIVCGFKDEEGNRFPFGMVGSKAICGLVKEEQLRLEDKDGISLACAIADFGGDPLALKSCRLENPYHFVELHIEQGKVLEDKKRSVGIVTSIASMKKYALTIHGESGHAGGLPMSLRHDPVMAACSFMLECEGLTKEVEHAVATFGTLSMQPGSFNIVPDTVTFTLDLRTAKDEDIDSLEKQLREVSAKIDKQRGVHTKWEMHQAMQSCPCDQMSMDDLEIICQKEQISYEKLMSGAGHDAMNFRDICPVTMLFVRSKNGYSHRKEEYTTKKDCAMGVDVLYHFIHHLGKG